MIRKNFEYQFWATDLMLTKLETLPEVPVKASLLLSHIFNAQEIWLSRINNRKKRFEIFEVHHIAQLRQVFEDLKLQLFAEIEKGDWATIVRYNALDGTAYESSREEIFLHISNHGTYHNAQINQILVQNGEKAITIDFIAYSRRKV